MYFVIADWECTLWILMTSKGKLKERVRLKDTMAQACIGKLMKLKLYVVSLPRMLRLTNKHLLNEKE